MDIEQLTRNDLIALLDDLGGHGSSVESLQATDDETLVAIIKNRLALVVDMSRIESTLMRPLPIEWRAQLTARRGELEQAAKAAAAAGRQPPRGNLVVNIPAGIGVSHYYGARGRAAVARMNEDGRAVLDLFPDEFRALLQDRKHGLDWQNANSTLLSEIAR